MMSEALATLGVGPVVNNDAPSPVSIMRRYMDSLPQEPSPREELRSFQFWKAVRTEFVATLLLVVFGCGSCMTSTLPNRDLEVKVALAFGLAMATLIQWVGPVSGGHLNPAVTVALLVTRHISPLRAGFYGIAQCLGGMAGTAILYGLVPSASRSSAGFGATEPVPELHSSQAFGMEFLGTLIVVLTVLTNVDPQRMDAGFRAFSIGMAYSLSHLLAFQYTGASLNPARSLGPAIVTNTWKQHWIYWIGPLLGGIIGGFTYEYTHDSSHSGLKRSFRRKNPLQRDHSALSSNETEMTSNDYRI